MRTTIEIPGVDDLKTQLDGLHALITARTWHRSAIVRAHVALYKGESGMTFGEFGKLGIKGLSNAASIRNHAMAWELTGLPRPQPGSAVDLSQIPSTLAYPELSTSAAAVDRAGALEFPDVSVSTISNLRKYRRGLVAAFVVDPSFADDARKALVKATQHKVNREYLNLPATEQETDEARRLRLQQERAWREAQVDVQPLATPEQIAKIAIRGKLRDLRIAATALIDMPVSDEVIGQMREGVDQELDVIRGMLAQIERKFGTLVSA